MDRDKLVDRKDKGKTSDEASFMKDSYSNTFNGIHHSSGDEIGESTTRRTKIEIILKK